MSVLGEVGMQLYAIGYDAAHLENVGNHTGSLGLQHDITDGSTLYGTCYDGNAQAIGRHLHQVMIICTSAYDMQLLDGEWCQLAEIAYHLTVTEGQTLEDTTGLLTIGLGDGPVSRQ